MLPILLIDDSSDDRILIIRQLHQEFSQLQVKPITNLQEFAQALEAGNFDLVITDYQLHWSDGITLLNAIKSRYPNCPVIMFTNSGSQEIAVEAMKSGLDDYIIKAPQYYIRLRSAIRSILERAQERRRAASLEIRLQSLLAQLNVGVFRSTLEGQLVEANAAFLHLLGVKTLAEAQAMNLPELFVSSQEDLQQDEQGQQQQQFPAREVQLRRADGTLIWVSWSQILRNIEGELFIDGLVEDITQRKQLEQTLQQQAQELAQANRLKDEFLASLSHELRTPLNAILGWSQILLSRPTDAVAMTRALEIIKRNAQLQTRLVDDILNASHLIEGKFQLQVAPVNLIPIVRTVMEVVRPAAEAKGIRLELRLDVTVGMVLGDANRLQQIIWNLLSNAIKFTPQQGQVKVQLKQVGADVQLVVRDTGIGISAEFLPYVFDRFRQADSSTTRTFGGLGLGLSLVRHLVELHGGTVKAESLGAGQGAVFTLQFPQIEQRQAESQAELSAPRREREVKKNTSITLEGLRVLVVDDEEDVRELLLVVFEEYQVQVTAVASAAAALEVIKQSVPDVLVCDIGMPQEDGYSLMRKVRTLPPEQGGEILAIALTAYAREEDRQQALESGFQMHVPKPIEPDTLISLVATLVGRSEAA